MSRYRWISRQEAEALPVAAAARAMGLSRQAPYAWRHRVARGHDPTTARLEAEIRAIATEKKGTYGSPRIIHELCRRGWCVNHKLLERLMREPGSTP